MMYQLGLGIGLIVAAAALGGCERCLGMSDQPQNVVVHVKDAAGAPISGAVVALGGKPCPEEASEYVCEPIAEERLLTVNVEGYDEHEESVDPKAGTDELCLYDLDPVEVEVTIGLVQAS